MLILFFIRGDGGHSVRCILHIGTEKTGSTSLQTALSVNREHLSERGIFYSKAAGTLNSRALAAAFCEYSSDDYLARLGIEDTTQHISWRNNLLDKIREEVVTAQTGHDTFLLSSEHFSSRLVREEQIASLKSFLLTLFADFDVACYLRRQDRMAVSRHNEVLRAGFAEPILPNVQASDSLPLLFDFEALLRRWSKLAGQSALKPRIYDKKALVDGDVVDDFSKTFLHTRLPERPLRQANVALSKPAQDALHMFNTAMGPRNRKALSQARRKLSQYLEIHAPGQGRQPTSGEAREFYNLFKKGNDLVARTYFDKEILFPENFNSEYPEIEDSKHHTGAQLLLQYFEHLIEAQPESMSLE